MTCKFAKTIKGQKFFNIFQEKLHKVGYEQKCSRLFDTSHTVNCCKFNNTVVYSFIPFAKQSMHHNIKPPYQICIWPNDYDYLYVDYDYETSVKQLLALSSTTSICHLELQMTQMKRQKTAQISNHTSFQCIISD